MRNLAISGSIITLLIVIGCSKNESPMVPEVTTAIVSGISSTSAESGGTVVSDFGASVTARGVCWSINPTPTINDNKTSDGAGGGNFVSSISGLTPNTSYFVRAYAANANGIGYGLTLAFSTTTDPQEGQLAKLSKTWKSTAVIFNTNGLTGYENFSISMSGTPGQDTFNYTVTGRPAGVTTPWPSSGFFTFGTGFFDLSRDDGIQVTYVVSDTQLEMLFTYTGSGFTGRTSNVEGAWRFIFEQD